MITAILLRPKNFETISLQTDGLLIPELQKLHEDLGGSYFIIRNFVERDGTKYETWTLGNSDWLTENFEFDEDKIITQYTRIDRKDIEE